MSEADSSSPSPGLTTGGSDKPPVVFRKRSRFTYQLDVKFGRPGREKRYENLSRMSFLPSEDVPAVLFMGVPQDEKSALFFVDPNLSHAGEGECMPSKAQCTFLELGIGREHFLSVGDYEFRIRLLDIKRVKLSEERKQRYYGLMARETARLHRLVEDLLTGRQDDLSRPPDQRVVHAQAVRPRLELAGDRVAPQHVAERNAGDGLRAEDETEARPNQRLVVDQ